MTSSEKVGTQVRVGRETAPYRPVPNEDVAFLGTEPIPAAVYFDRSYYESERTAIFRRTWLHIGRESELAEPGAFIVRRIEAAGASILVTRSSADGQLRAFYNVCSHRGTELVWEEAGCAKSFSCHYHMWNYDNDGRLRSVTDESRFFGIDKESLGLRPVSVGTCAGFVFVNMDPEPEDLATFLGPIGDELEGLGLGGLTEFCQYSYEVEANWKLAFDNFQENYHLRWVHAPSTRGSATSPENPFGYPWSFRFSGLHRSTNLWLRADRPPSDVQNRLMAAAGIPAGAAVGPTAAEFYCLFPNIFVAPLGVGCFTQQIWPVAPDRSRSVIRVYWDGHDRNASMRFQRELAMASIMDVHIEDRELIEASHRGLMSGAVDHIHFQAQEVLLRHFWLSVDGVVRAHRAQGSAMSVASEQ